MADAPTLNKDPFNQTITLQDVGGSALDFSKFLDQGENQAFGDYLAKQQSQEKPLDIFTKLEESAGIPQLKQTSTTLQGQVNDLEDTIKRVEGNVSATTANSYVTEGQRQGMVESRKQPLLERLGEVGTSLGRVQQSIDRAGADVATKTGLVLQGQSMELDPYVKKMDMVSNQAARAMTGFTADRETRLNLLLDKLQAQRQLSLAEYQEASSLYRQQLAFENAKAEFDRQQAAQVTGRDTALVDVGGAKRLIDSQTGEIIATYNDVNSGGGGASVQQYYSSPNSYYGSNSNPGTSYKTFVPDY